ncbi:pseudouridylate synthase [Reichenbachiella sp. 5M10]|uniref:pseudouridine synthase n=1 Tax=Reichenbachiella sp. 5M10 TaxID=1889772 RepID=UPI000C35FDB4|nr:pseudouridine synthase [Reichenbachiella sp. 5M10]PIB35206.1 pseudouridylate synthase [Reichenbachiella sp. 5M10]
MEEPLEIIYQDEHYVAINKPHGLMVHRSKISRNTDQFALQQLRNQIDQRVYPAHRLDRKTSGVLLFALHEEALKKVRKIFDEQQIHKTYWAIVRGHTVESETINYALTNDNGKVQPAVTHYRTVDRVELEVPHGKFSTSRYAWVEAYPETGRMHQLRKHFAHIYHPIIGDRPHGCNKQNKLFLEKWKMNTMLLHARSMEFVHPFTFKKLVLQAHLHPEFERMMLLMGFIHQD